MFWNWLFYRERWEEDEQGVTLRLWRVRWVL